MLKRLDTLVSATEASLPLPGGRASGRGVRLDPGGKTAVLFVNGFNGLGLHTLFSVLKQFNNVFRNFVFVQVGVVDAVNFSSPEKIREIERQMSEEAERYCRYVKKYRVHAEARTSVGVDVVDRIVTLATDIQKHFPGAVFFGGQLVFSKDSVFYRGLHNYTIFSVQRKLHFEGIPVVIMPIRVY
jgi:hypothetical protein